MTTRRRLSHCHDVAYVGDQRNMIAGQFGAQRLKHVTPARHEADTRTPTGIVMRECAPQPARCAGKKNTKPGVSRAFRGVGHERRTAAAASLR
jgi:hypothetical protein